MRGALITLAGGLALIAACGARSAIPVPEVRRGGAGGDAASSAGATGGGGCVVDPGIPTVLEGRIRDFSMNHPDFEHFIGDDRGIVLDHLGTDGKPIYAGQDGHPSTSGQANFDAWYRDTPGVNLGEDVTLPLVLIPGGLALENDAFFPIDGQLLGDEGLPHNFHFTLEAHASFRYQGGEVFAFEGDDDMFVFVSGSLALDLGGVHGPEGGQIDVDALGLELGGVFPLDIFFAERHTSGSTFRLELLGFTFCK